MYYEFSFIIPRDEMIDECFKSILEKLNISINVQWLEEKINSYKRGKGDILVFHNRKDYECFIIIDCYLDPTDQLGVVEFGVRTSNILSEGIKKELQDWRDKIWYWDKKSSVLNQHYNDELKLKSECYENNTFEEYRLKNLEWHNHLLKQEWFNCIGTPKYLESIQKNQPIVHYIDGVKIN